MWYYIVGFLVLVLIAVTVWGFAKVLKDSGQYTYSETDGE